MYNGVVGGHFSYKITARKILDASYWWSALYKEKQITTELVTNAKELEEWQIRA